MASLSDFLKAEDLDDLLKIRHALAQLDTEDDQRVSEIVSEWRNGQAISNLLFYPQLMPGSHRWGAIDRALDNRGQGYYILAALVGLQSIDPASVPDHYRRRWTTFILNLISADLGIYSERASVTIYRWLPETETHQLIQMYPAPDNLVSKNIIAFALARWGSLSRTEFRDRLRRAGLGLWHRRAFLKRHRDYERKTRLFLTLPLLCYIPNFKDFLAAQ